jgi:outer membrane protein assembly factor BamE
MKSIFALTLLSFLLSGCGGVTPYKAPITQGIVVTPEMLESLQPGLSKQQVRQLLGPNYGENPFKPNQWEYIYTSTDPNIHPDAVGHLRLEFDPDGYLTTWQQVK